MCHFNNMHLALYVPRFHSVNALLILRVNMSMSVNAKLRSCVNGPLHLGYHAHKRT